MPIPAGGSAPIVRRRVQDDIYGALLALIVSGELAPGERLQDDQLIAWAGASRTSVREAIARLERTGFVTAGRGRLTHVAQLDSVAIAEAALIYRVLVVHAVREVVPLLSREEKAELRSFIQAASTDTRLRHAISDGGLKAGVCDWFLHRYGNQITIRLTEPYGLHVQRLLSLRGSQLNTRDIRAILAALAGAVAELNAEDAAAQVSALFEGPIAALIHAVPLIREVDDATV